MDMWLLCERKTELLHKRLHEQQLRDQIEFPTARRTWRRRSAFQCGLMLLRLARRLIQYGRPSAPPQVDLPPVLRQIP
jgi:hypothetical protein